MRGKACCDDWEAERQNKGFRNRTSSVVDLDIFFKRIFNGLEEKGVLDNTYVIFRSVATEHQMTG